MHPKCRIETHHVQMPFRSQTSRLPGPYNYTNRSCSSVRQSQRLLVKTEIPKSKKALQRYIGFLNYYRNYIPRLSERLSPFFQLLKETTKFYVPTILVEEFTNLKKLLENSCQLALRQPLKDKPTHSHV